MGTVQLLLNGHPRENRQWPLKLGQNNSRALITSHLIGVALNRRLLKRGSTVIHSNSHDDQRMRDQLPNDRPFRQYENAAWCGKELINRHVKLAVCSRPILFISKKQMFPF